MDSRITNDCKLLFQFYLHLPQHTYDGKTDTYTTVGNHGSSISTLVSRSLSGCFDSSAQSNLITSTPSKEINFSSPSMQLFLSTSNKSKTTKNGYYGELDFFDTQFYFDKSFGVKPSLLPVHHISDESDSIHKVLTDYPERCKLDLFMHLCMLDYVGHEQVDVLLNGQEICRKISAIKQLWSTLDEL